jgi:uncharacterized membrane protein (DUF106 family)
MKWLIILILFLLLMAIILFRYRKQLQTAYVMWRTFRNIRQQMKPKQKKVEKKSSTKDTELVRCPKCNKWTPQDEAVKLKSNYYCSHSCMEESLSFNS